MSPMTQNEKKKVPILLITLSHESPSSFDAGLHQMKPCKVIEFMLHSGLHHRPLGCFAISADCEVDWMRPDNQPDFNRHTVSVLIHAHGLDFNSTCLSCWFLLVPFQ